MIQLNQKGRMREHIRRVKRGPEKKTHGHKRNSIVSMKFLFGIQAYCLFSRDSNLLLILHDRIVQLLQLCEEFMFHYLKIEKNDL